MNQNDIDKLIDSWLTPAIRCWYKDQILEPYKAFYLYYKPSTENENGSLVIADSPLNENYKLADPRRVSPEWSTTYTKQLLTRIAYTLPILKTKE